MEGKDLQSLMETYLKMNESVELLNEIDADEMGTPSLASRNAASQRENEAKLKRLRAQRDLSGRPPVANLPSNLKSTEQGATAAGMRVAGKMADIRGSQTPGSQTPKTTSTTSSSPRPSGSSSKPAAPAKPFVKQTGDKAKDMATWAKANPKLAAAAAEKSRIRGTQQTDNPLMKDMRSKLPMNSPSVQSPAVAKLGAGHQSLVKNPNAFKAAPPKPAAKPASTPAAKPAKRTPTQIRQGIYSGVDIFDLVKGYLLDEGYAETEENALVIMTNMSEEWRDEIVERYKGKHGQSSDEYKRDRSPGGKMVSGDDKQSGAEYTHGRRVKAENPGSQPDEGGKTKPKSQGKMDKGTRADLEYRKANLKKEEAEYVDENRRAARSAGGYKDDSEGQPDPSKDGFTGIGKMSIKDIMALNKKIEARKAKKEETQVEGDQIDEVLGGQAGDGYIGHPRLGIKNPMAKKQTNTNTSSNTGIAGKLGNRASQMDAAMKAARGQ